jgi:hypothetical protein
MSFALESKYIDRRGNFRRERSLLETSDEVLAVLRDHLEDDAFSDLVIVHHDILPEPAKELWA